MSNTKEEKEKQEPDILEQSQAEAASNLAGWQKALADYQNLQKEHDKNISYLRVFLSSEIIGQLLPIFDHYKSALNHIPESEQKQAWAIGLEHVYKLWETFLAEQDVTEIKALQQKFDPVYHESVGEISDKNIADQEIVEVKQAGYMHKDQVLRPSKVIINNL